MRAHGGIADRRRDFAETVHDRDRFETAEERVDRIAATVDVEGDDSTRAARGRGAPQARAAGGRQARDDRRHVRHVRDRVRQPRMRRSPNAAPSGGPAFAGHARRATPRSVGSSRRCGRDTRAPLRRGRPARRERPLPRPRGRRYTCRRYARRGRLRGRPAARGPAMRRSRRRRGEPRRRARHSRVHAGRRRGRAGLVRAST